MHPIIAFCIWQIIVYVLLQRGCYELDEHDDNVTDLGETAMSEGREHPVQCPYCPLGNTTWNLSGICDDHVALSRIPVVR